MADHNPLSKDPIGIRNIPGNQINPATEDTLLGLAGMVSSAYDYISASYPTTSSEVYVFKTGGSGGTTIATITIVYTDTTKNEISTVTKT